MAVTILSGGTVITMNEEREVLKLGATAFSPETRQILDVGPAADLTARFPETELVDCTGQIVMPGLINTHTHLFQTLLKGLGDDRTLLDWLMSMTAPSAAALTAQDCYAAALHGCAEALSTGTTTVVDFMYVHPREGLGDAVIQAMEDVGIRGIMARGFVTSGGDIGLPATLVEDAAHALADTSRLIDAHNKPGARVSVGIAPNMIWTVDEKTLRGTRELAQSSGALVTMHLSESDFIIDEAERRFGMRDIPFAENIGLLSPNFLAAHCVKAQPADIAILASTGASVSHNPCSNMYLGNGFAPVPAMLEAGIAVGLGTDGSASSSNMSMLQTIKFAALIHKGARQDPEVMTAERALEMATIQGARAIGKADEIGSLERGKRADIIVLDTTNYCITPLHRAASAVVYSARGDEVQRVYVDGREVVSGGDVQTVNGADARRAAQSCADALTERAGTASLGRRAWRSAL